MTDACYPTEILDQEAELGFELLEVFASAGFCQNSFFVGWVSVVAKVINESDIVVKTKGISGRVVYIHKRFGKFEYDNFESSKNEWHNFSNGFQTDPNQAIIDAGFGADRDDAMIKIIPAKAEIKRP